MKKKSLFIATILLIGVSQIFQGCLKDIESPTVAKVREAKALELESIAAVNNAEASAKVILAQAESALKMAEVEVQKAQAAKTLAEAEITKKQAELLELQMAGQEIDNQAKQAELEAALVNLEIKKKEAEMQIAAIATQMEKMQVEAQAQLLELQLMLKRAQKDLDDEKKAELQELSNRYQTLVKTLIVKKTDLFDANADLIAAENGLLGAKEYADTQIEENNKKIAELKMDIEHLKTYSTYKSASEIEELKARMDELDKQYDIAYEGFCYGRNNYFDIIVDETEAQEILNELNEQISFLNNYYKYPIRNYKQGAIKLEGSVFPVELTLGEGENSVTYTYRQMDTVSIVENTLTIDIRRAKIDVDNLIAAYEKEIETRNDWVKEVQSAYDGEATKGMYPYYETVLDEDGNYVPSTEPCRNLVDSTAYLKTAYEAEEDAAKKSALKTDYLAAIEREENCLESLNNQKEIIELYVTNLENLNADWAIFSDLDKLAEDLNVKVEAYNAAIKKAHIEKIEAWKEWGQSNYTIECINSEYDAIYSIVYNSFTDPYGNRISANSLDQMIANYEEEIAALEADNEDYRNMDTSDIEHVIETIKAKIDALKSEVEVLEKMAADAKAELDAAMSE